MSTHYVSRSGFETPMFARRGDPPFTIRLKSAGQYDRGEAEEVAAALREQYPTETVEIIQRGA